MFSSARKALLAAGAACLLALPPVQAAVAAPDQGAPDNGRAIYTVPNTDSGDRTKIHRMGADILSAKDGTATVEATAAQAEEMRQAGLAPSKQSDVTEELAKRSRAGAADFPPGDEAYHNYQEINQELDKTVSDHPDIAKRFSAGKSFEGKDIPGIKISGNAGQDEDEPEVLFTCNQHAREHLTTEMCLRIVNRFTDGYANNQAIKEMVDSREILVIPTVNPDGSIYDVQSGQYQGWRKNRQDTGTDLNRNWGYKWACCGGSSDNPQDETYHGPKGFSAPETQAIRDFVNSRVIDGKQQITANIDFHSFSELVLWPFGHTNDEVTEGMTREEYDRFERVGTAMADTNGYTPQQSSDLYITDGDINGWMWGKHKILSFTFEMFPSSGGIDGFYPPGDVIERETKRNDKAVDILLKEAGA